MLFFRNCSSAQSRLFLVAFAIFQLILIWYLFGSSDLNRKSALTGSSPSPDVLIYNRIPKTGSTSLMHLPYKLYKNNHLNVMFVNISGGPTSYTMSTKNQINFVHNITQWTARHPAIFHGHFAYVDVDKFKAETGAKTAYINVIRQPIERLISYYYFLRYGDDFRINKIRSKMGDKVTFDECVANRQPDCDPRKLWLQVPWFCGHSRRCWSPPGNSWALEQAKQNLVNKYWLVGVTEELDTFIEVLEWMLPKFFEGATDLYKREGEIGKNHIRKTIHKDSISEDTLAVLQSTKVWKVEHEFYEFAYQQFKWIKDEFEDAKRQETLERDSFHFDKVRIP